MWKRSVLLLGVLLLFTAVLYGGKEEAADPIRVLPLEEYLPLATQKDTEFEEILINELRLRYQKDLDLPARDLVLSVKEDLAIFLDRGETDSDTEIRLSKLFPMSGTGVSTSYDVTPLNAGSRTSEWRIGISQPIAKNAFGRSTRLLDKIVGLEVDVARHQIIEAYEDYMAVILTSYLNWYEAYNNREVGRSSYRENLKLLDNIQARIKSKIAIRIDVNKIKIQVLSKKETLVRFEEEYERALNFIKRAIRYEGKETLIPEPPKSYLPAKEHFEESFEWFRAKGRTYRILDLLEERSTLEVAKEADDLLPSIHVLADYRRKGQGNGLEQPENRISAGISLEWPFGHQKDRAQWEVSKIERDRTRLSIENTHFRLYTEIKNLHLRREREIQLKAIADEKISMAESILIDETENYTFGKVTLNDYIDAVNRLDNSRFSQILHDAQGRRLAVEWLRITDLLVREEDIRRRPRKETK